MKTFLRAPERMVAGWLSVLILATMVLWGCSAPKPVAQSQLDASNIRRIVVFPFKNMYAVYGDNVSFTCPICGNSFIIAEVAEGGEWTVTDSFLSALNERKGFQLITPDAAYDIQSSFMDTSSTQSDLDLMVKVGKNFQADALIMGRVYRYQERIGTKLAADTPASVAFDVLLLEADSGRLLWEGHFKETQKSLSENLYNFRKFFKRGGKWLTAAELTDIGVEEVLKTFPKPQ